MRTVNCCALALSVAAGFSSGASAQVTTDPAGVLFFEGDTVRHRVDGQAGPFCVQTNRFMRGEAIAFRTRILAPDGSIADDTVLTGAEVVLGSGDRLEMHYGGHGNPATDAYWSVSWTIPDDLPTGTLGYEIHATTEDGTVVTWEPFVRTPTQVTIIDGVPEAAPAEE